jgi:apolipoprotein N-acyltransferase
VKRALLYAAGSGLALSLAFPPAGLSPLAFVALVPLLVACRDLKPGRAFLVGWLAGIVFFTVTVWWLTVAMTRYGGIPPLLAWPILLLLAGVLAVYPALFAAGAAWALGRGLRGPAAVVGLAALWTILEWGRSLFPLGGFPWGNLAYTQYRVLPLVQTASLTGPWGTGFVLAAANAALFGLLAKPAGRGGRTGAWTGLGLAGLLLAASFLFGLGRLAGTGAGESLAVAVLQGNLAQDVKWDPSHRERTLEIYRELTQAAARADADLIVWPEAATPFYFQVDSPFSRQVTQIAREAGKPLLFGSPAFLGERRERRLRNRVYLLDGEGEVRGSYDKMHLVPFGEYVPWKRLLSFVGPLVQEVGDFTPGGDRTLLPLDGARFGCVICYEIIFPDLVRRFVKDGATFMGTVTNDAWYGRSSASLQHFAQMVFRAVETGVPFFRAANTGISGVVDARGRILRQTDLFVGGMWVERIVPSAEKTPYVRWGDWFPLLCLLVVAAAAAGLALRRRSDT